MKFRSQNWDSNEITKIQSIWKCSVCKGPIYTCVDFNMNGFRVRWMVKRMRLVNKLSFSKAYMGNFLCSILCFFFCSASAAVAVAFHSLSISVYIVSCCLLPIAVLVCWCTYKIIGLFHAKWRRVNPSMWIIRTWILFVPLFHMETLVVQWHKQSFILPWFYYKLRRVTLRHVSECAFDFGVLFEHLDILA